MPAPNAPPPPPNVHKIMIRSYNDKRFQDSAGCPTFTIPINPEQLAQRLKVENNDNQGAGAQGASSRHGRTPPEEIKLDFILDNTNTVAGNILQGTAIDKQVEQLISTVYLVAGKIHSPRFLKISWNDKNIFGKNKPAFECKLKSLDITYVLFTTEGEPLRAKISATFQEYIEAEKSEQQKQNNSPDLTHVRTATPADRLWLLTHGIYGDPKYLLQVAQANNLSTLRQVKSGDEIYFPPFDPAEKKALKQEK